MKFSYDELMQFKKLIELLVSTNQDRRDKAIKENDSFLDSYLLGKIDAFSYVCELLDDFTIQDEKHLK